jgi:hypothetical protein
MVVWLVRKGGGGRRHTPLQLAQVRVRVVQEPSHNNYNYEKYPAGKMINSPALVAQHRHWWRNTGTGGAVCKGATPSVEQ